MSTLDGRDIVPGADLPLRAPGRLDTVVGVSSPSRALSNFKIADMPPSDLVRSELDALRDGQQVGAIAESSWSRLITSEPGLSAPVGSAAEISPENDAGSHVDPIKPGNQIVPNAGRFVRRNTSATGWEFLSANTLASKANKADLDEVVATGVLDIFDQSYQTGDYLTFAVPDAADPSRRRRLGRFRGSDGALDVKLALSVDGRLPLGAGSIEMTDEFGDDLEIVRTRNGRVVRRVLADGTVVNYGKGQGSDTPAEVAQARGTTASLSDRLSPTIRADGLPADPIYNGHTLSETRRLVQALRAGIAGSQLVISTITDSWGDNRSYWLERYSLQLKAQFGNAGVGFMPVERGGPDTLAGTLSRTVGWVIANRTTPGPGLVSATSSAALERFTITGGKGDSVRMCYLGGTGGVMRYRYDSGSWTTINLDGVGTQYVQLGTPPAGVWAMNVEVVSGNCTIYGFDVRDTAALGVRINKLGAGGSRLSEWVSQDLAQWAAGFSPLGSNLVVVLFGPNDAYNYSAAAYADYAATLIDRIRSASPWADIALVSPPQNLGTATVTQKQQAYELRKVAAAKRCVHVDLQPFYGETTAAYDGSARNYINLADPHHLTERGGCILSEIMLRLTAWSQ
ncbi:GDSL-type esterase/lipase family protein [Stenotrophomonas sp. GD03819]|uniref:SGNH/GDSL hydrolase family protein n=1 Tax=Stenotrophomonas sp. GD03819 TaxID=2975384 RepID=UPI00244761B7|nr:GDSL-type esterase/lipase family protein [Stenotrophomonas sp. GD03819]MDH1792957.1 GDSL-type esterase/lipase family protein [Stenotrophomonas sp. GD03819]